MNPDPKVNRYRHYQPELGRFLQPDPKHFEAGDYNLYRYCHNDPVNKSDPTGLDILIDPNTTFLFQAKQFEGLMDTARTVSGAAALTQLINSPNLHVFTEKTDMSDGRSELVTPNSMKDATNGNGTGSTIRINHFDTASTKDTPGSQTAHAVGHAQEVDSGTSNKPAPSTLSPLNYMAHPAEQNANKLELEVKLLDKKDFVTP